MDAEESGWEKTDVIQDVGEEENTEGKWDREE